ncbi:MAG TPA: hypothetical protein PK833_12165 [Vicingus sp.]|nr:hypothetical protein [Vicingus sp.]
MNLENNSFLIFKPDNKFHITPNRVVYTLFLVTFIPAAIELIIVGEDNFSELGEFLLALSISVMLVAQFYRFFSMNNHEPILGDVVRGLKFCFDTIHTDEAFYEIKNIRKIEIYCGSFEGDIIISRGNYNGGISNGLHNKLIIHFNDNKQVEIFFHQAYEYEIRKIKAYLIHYHLQGKIHFLRLIELLGITDYDEIQKFKKEIYIESISDNPLN